METAVLVGVGILLAALGALVGVVLGRYVWPSIRDSGTQRRAQGSRKNAAPFVPGQSSMEAELSGRIEELRRSGEEAARLGERVESLKGQAEEQGNAARVLEVQRDTAAGEAKAGAAEIARLKEREKALVEKVAEQAALLADSKSSSPAEFENIANRILKANASELSESSQKALSRDAGPAAGADSGFSEESRDRL